jgi:hypothetical protein
MATKNGVFDVKQSKSVYKFDHNIGFWEKRHFGADDSRKSHIIVIITSTPDSRSHRKCLSLSQPIPKYVTLSAKEMILLLNEPMYCCWRWVL